MRVLQIHNYYRFRGGECAVVDNERDLLVGAGHEVRLFSANTSDIAKSSLLMKSGVFLAMHANPSVRRDLSLVLRDYRPDIVHVHNVYPLLGLAVYRVLRDAKVPVVQTVHNYRFQCPNGLHFVNDQLCEECPTRGFFSAVRKRCLHHSIGVSAAYAYSIASGWSTGLFPTAITVWITLNRFGASRLAKQGVPQDRIRIIGNFVANFPPAGEFEKEHFLYVGRLSLEKGIHTLLLAAELVPDIQILIAGTGPIADHSRAFVRDRGLLNVHFLGQVDRTCRDATLARSFAFLCPSVWYENFPLAIVEALAAGVPVIASRVGGVPEMIDHGRTGLLVSPNAPDELATAMRMLFTDSAMRTSMSKAAVDVAHSSFSASAHLRQLIDTYEFARTVMDTNG